MTKAKDPGFANIFDAIEDVPAERENMKLRASLMVGLLKFMKREKLTQKDAAKMFGITQPRVSDLVRGKIDLFSLDTLVNMATAAGLQVDMKVRKAA
ncbi:MAG: XRE family transcriptional regulator [Parvibaculum sp.]|uniref:helix-turn-helix domain-containing protein n=1 Tax=Parvibaculum sp. TaxID=2024848 RepID=UPI0019B0509A|nr:XRE family transcriptional regulator [Parvibaculum sp.]MBC7104015.1 XRE family transcriptional regulator [Parvibaculum sp.]MDZ4382574.1 XRE family transcriptional regulator [Parvibaculum sp.]